MNKGIPVYVHPDDYDMVSQGYPGGAEYGLNYTPYQPDTNIHEMGRRFGMKVIDTPGHTLGCVTFQHKRMLYTGDTTTPKETDDENPYDLTFEFTFNTLLITLPERLDMQKNSLLLLLQRRYSKRTQKICPGHSKTYENDEIYILRSIALIEIAKEIQTGEISYPF
jgi:glyoxylase-like metal-dependent hydrolase (beta-lactamase superfamily II)